ncbi:hypothetical protein PROVALCAL_00599 [Providencia alcalifaciens DSM 30120]|uniref:Uncharacterized protein n=1 Tax=Providencia alcalifaciens DSM 30120 TaxID=520999 RepID=B6XB52_9GAMM|nr:hypothetical protein PROVALCAL_00599 [Providencia alcalifaciens DSM 30120]
MQSPLCLFEKILYLFSILNHKVIKKMKNNSKKYEPFRSIAGLN